MLELSLHSTEKQAARLGELFHLPVRQPKSFECLSNGQETKRRNSGKRVLISTFAVVVFTTTCLCCLSKAESADLESPVKHPPILISGYPSTVRASSCFLSWGCKGQYAVFSALVQARAGKTIEAVSIQTAGLGDATLTVSSVSPCPATATGATAQLTLGSLTPTSTRVCVFVPLALIPEADMSVKGDILVLASGFDPVAARVEIQRSPEPSRTAFLWFIGIAVPAMVAFWLNNLATHLTEARTRRRTELDAFESDKEAKSHLFRTYFEDYLPGFAGKSNPEFVRGAYGELVRQGSWSRIPWKQRRRLYRYVSNEEVTNAEFGEFKKELRLLFPEWRDSIDRF
jgi:hypothetical protein